MHFNIEAIVHYFYTVHFGRAYCLTISLKLVTVNMAYG
jgi:hypothetical protein